MRMITIIECLLLLAAVALATSAVYVAFDLFAYHDRCDYCDGYIRESAVKCGHCLEWQLDD